MTGTPMMNNVGELYSLIRFLGIKPYNSLEKFSHDFTLPLKKNSHTGAKKAMQMLQALLKAILLRRAIDAYLTWEILTLAFVVHH